MSEHIHRSHNVSVLLCHLVCPAKDRRVVFSAEVDKVLRDVCLEIAARDAIVFLGIGTDRDHVHFLVQTIPPYSPTRLVRVINSLTVREIFRRVPTVKQYLWGGEFWSDGSSISTVGRATGAKGRSNATASNRAGRKSTLRSIRNSSGFSEGIRPVRSDTPRLAAG